MGIDKNILLMCNSIYWPVMNSGGHMYVFLNICTVFHVWKNQSVKWIMILKTTLKDALHVLIFSKHCQSKIVHHEIQGKPWEVV